MHYTPHIDLAFLSLEYFMRQVDFGWLIRYIHANGASMFFGAIYLHIARGIFYSSYAYPRGQLWFSGVTIFLLMMATGFMGYVLPWGQMSFWGVTVITNLFSAIPLIGEGIVQWLWGGFSVDNATLNRFFSLHYLLPFAIAGVSLVHLVLLHENGSNNPLGIDSKMGKVSFYPYFYVKDLFGLFVFGILFSIFVFFAPNALGHPDNYIPANSLVTPAHIVPEWYYLPFYAILRSIPDKLGGVIAMFGSILILYLLPIISQSRVRSTFFRPMYKTIFWVFAVNTLILGWIGQKVVEYPFVEIGQFSTVLYFGLLLVVIPFFSVFEEYLLKYK